VTGVHRPVQIETNREIDSTIAVHRSAGQDETECGSRQLRPHLHIGTAIETATHAIDSARTMNARSLRRQIIFVLQCVMQFGNRLGTSVRLGSRGISTEFLSARVEPKFVTNRRMVVGADLRAARRAMEDNARPASTFGPIRE
jgi:hypothetical protein